MMLRVIFFTLLLCLFSVSAGASGIKFSDTAKDFINKYRVEVVFYPEEIAGQAVPYSECVECKTFLKTNDIEKYKEHLKQIQKMKDLDTRYTYTKNYVGYDVYRRHLDKYMYDEKFIGSVVYVSPTVYRTQKFLVYDAANKKKRLSEIRHLLTKHIQYVQGKINEFIN